MQHILHWQHTAEGITFTCTRNGVALPIGDWARHSVALPDGQPASTAPLLHLLEEERAQPTEDETALAIANDTLADMEEWQTRGLGLPPHAPVRLSLDYSGVLANTNFKIRYGFAYDNGIPLSGATVDGALLRQGEKHWLLANPLYQLVSRIKAYQDNPIEDMDARFLWWSELSSLLPKESAPAGFLGQMQAVRPDSFSLDFREENGRITILPRFVRSKAATEDTHIHEDILPAAISDDFQRRFARQIQPEGRYALRGNWFIVLPPTVRTALETVHRINGASESEKRQFLHNPRAAIREKLEASFGDLAESTMEGIFQETPLFLSERIKHLGKWEPKAGFYIQTPTGDWFPGDELPRNLLLPIGCDGALVDVRPTDIPGLQAQLRNARETGSASVFFGNATVLANDTTEALLDKAQRMFVPRAPDAPTPETTDEKTEKGTKEVPIIFDHLSEMGIRLEPTGLRRAVDIAPPLRPEVRLHEHQQHGLKWLQAHWLHGSPGALLADDMGLGKTLQTLAFLGWIKEQQRAGAAQQRPFLIVAPTGLLRNWEEEADKFLAPPALGHLVRAHGAELRTIASRGSLAAARELEHAGLVLTTYETLRDKITIFMAVHWGAVIFDEAQKIKNPKAMTTEMAKSLKAEFSLSLTGTPVENSLADLWCILDAVHPLRLETFKVFASTYMPDGTPTTDTLETLKAELGKPEGFPSLLRRIKETHWVERPQKKQNILPVTMPPEQAAAYQQALAKAASEAGRPGAALEALQHIRTLSLHPYATAWGTIPPDAFIEASARLKGTFDLLREVQRAGEKALLFIEFRQMQMVLTELLQNKLGCEQVLVINGEVSGHKRQERVHAFQNRKGFDVILLAPKAAGVGLTLTAATHVIHLSRWWNPAVEDQCTDRAYRIGQQKDVTVHYPQAVHPALGEASFDIKLHQLLERKRTLSRDLLSAPPASSKELDQLLADVMGNMHQQQATTEARLLDQLDIMEPLQFEDWVASRLNALGFAVQKTPASGDGGADIIATAQPGKGVPNLLVQCKHTQSPDRPLGHDGIAEVIRSRNRYALPDPTVCLLVTNAQTLSTAGHHMAQENLVRLLGRPALESLERQDAAALQTLLAQ